MPESMTPEQLKEYVHSMPDDEIISVTVVFGEGRDEGGDRKNAGKEQA